MADIVINPAIGKIDFFTTKGESVTNTLRLTGNTLLVTGPLSASSISTGGGGAFVTSVQPTTNYLSKFTGNSTIANSVIYDNGTNVGIGSTSPTFKLDVNGSIALSGYRFADFNTYYNRIFEPAGNTAIYLGNASDPTNYSDNTNHAFRNRGGSSVYAYINSNGNLGIGTTSPGAPLTIYRASNPWIRVNGGGAFSYIQLDDGTSYGYLLKNSSSDTSNNALAGALYTYTDSGKAFQHIHSGTALFTILSGGSIGIGSAAPSYKLEVYSGAKTSAFTGLSISNFNNYDGTAASLVTSQLRFAILENPTGTYNAPARTFTILESGNEANNSSSDGFFAISTRSGGTVAEKLRLNSAGNLGIGTTNPTTKLAISDGTTIAQVNPSSGVAYFGSLNNYPVALSVNSSEKVRIISDGNVGIGSTAPAYKLEVIGDVRVSGGLVNAGLSAQWTLSGGGTATYNGSSILWNARVIAIPVERTEFGADGYIDITCPTSGTITYYNASNVTTTVTCNANGIPIANWESLYYEVTPGQSAASDQTKFRLVNYNNTTWRPSSNWLLICTRNGDGNAIKWLPGQIVIPNGGAFDSSNSTNNWEISGTTNYIARFTSANKIGNSSVLYDNGANIGIGTTSPGYKLHVVGDGYVTGNLTVGLTSNWSNINFIRSGGSTVGGFGWRSDGYFYVAGHPDYGPGAGNDVRVRGFGANLILGTNSTDYIWLNTSGNLGIGTNNPATKLQVIGGVEFGYGSNSIFYTGTAFDASNYLILQNNTDAYGRVGLTINAKTFSAANTPSTNDGWALDPRSGIRFRGWLSGDSGYDTKFVIQHLLANATNAVGDLGIFAKGYSSTVPAFVLAGGGNVGIGTTSPAYKLDVSGNARFTSDTFVNGNLMVSKAGANLYINGSNSDAEIHWQANGTSRWAMGMNVGDATENLNIYNYTTSTTNFTILKASGNVGIGSSSPVYKLDVNGIIASSGVAIAWFSGNYNRLYEPAGNPALYLGNNTDPANYYDNTTHYFRNRGGSTNYAIINSSGNLGVGTTVASYKVDVVGAVRATIDNDFSFVLKRSATNVWTGLGYYTANNSKWFVGLRETGDDNLRWYNYTNSAERMVLTEAGSLGVGTTNPGTKLDVVGEITTPVIKQSTTLYTGTDITDDNSTRTVYFNIPLGGYSPPKYFKVARIKITGNYQNVSLNGYFTTTNSTGLHVGSERKVEFDFIAYAATNPGAPTVTYLKRGPDTTNVLVYAVPNGGGAGTTYYDVYIKSAWYNDTNGELAVRVGYSSAVTIWQAGLDSGTSAPTDTLVNPNSSYSFDTSGNIGIGTTSPAYKLDVYGPVSLRGTRVLTTGFDIFGGLTYDIYGNIRVLRSDSAQADGMYIGYGGSGGPLRFFSNTGVQEFMTIATTGNVGIGSTSPAHRLDVVSGSIRASSGAYAGELYFGTNSNADLYLKRDNGYDLSLVQNASSGNALYLAGAGNVYLSIDSNNNETDRAFIVQNNSIKSGTELFRVNEAGSAIASSDFRAPIFYDSNNTGYYVDPASTSNLNAITLNNSGINSYLTLPGTVTISNVSSNEMVIRNLGQLRFSTSTSWDWNSWAGLKYDASATTIYMGGPAATSVFTANATPPSVTISFVGTTAVNSDSSFRAPIFYDSANTTYYVDPASTSNLVGLTVANTITGNITGNAGGNAAGSSTFVASLGSGLNYDIDRTTKRAGLSHYSGYSTGTNRPTTYDYTLQVTDGNKGWEISMDWIATTGPAIYARSLRDCCQNWSTWVRILDSVNYAYAANMNQNVRTTDNVTHNIVDATQFRDSANTSYYLDPASTSVLNYLSLSILNNMNPANGTWHTSAEGKARFYFASNSNTYFRTGADFIYRNNSDSGVLVIDSSGNLRTTSGGDNSPSYSLHVGGTGFAVNDFRAPIFYDSNDTGYYGDFASTSRLNILSLVSYAYINGQTLNGQSFYQWEGATYRNPGDHTPQLLIRKDNSTTGINGFAPALALYNNNGADQTTVGMTFVSAEAVSPTQGNSVELAGIIAKKESTGTAGGWSRGSLNFYTKDFGTRKDVMYMSPDGTVTVTGTDNNSGKADFSVDTGGTATMALSGQYFRVGSTDVNWAIKIQNDGYIATWAQQMRFSTDSGDNAITFATNSTNRVNIGGSTTETVKITGYANYVGNFGYNTLTLIDTSGYPGLNYRSGNNNWLMRMDGGGTYSMNWSSNASAKDVGTFSTPFYFGTGGTAYASNDFRAPIFYDANDTSYYVDPNSASVLNGLRLVSSGNQVSGGDYSLWIQGGNEDWGIGIIKSSANYGITYNLAASHTYAIQGNKNGTEYFRLGTDMLYHDTRVQAPIFYDSADTAYYLDPASTTTSLQIAGAIEQGNDLARPLVQWGVGGDTTGMIIIKLPGTSSNYGMIHAVIDIYEYSSNNVSTIIVGGHNWNGAWYNIGANVVGYTNKTVRLGFKDGQYCIVLGGASSVWSYGQVVLRKIQNGSYYTNNMNLGGTYSISQTATESFTYVSGDLTQLRTPGTFIAYGDVRAPIFYDSANTSYYLDPASTSVLYSIAAGAAGNSSANIPALKVTSAGTATTQAAIAIQQQASEGDTIIFCDFDQYVEWNLVHENAANQLIVHGGSSTGNLGSNTFYSPNGTAKTGYIKHVFDMTDGNAYIGGSVGIGTNGPGQKLDVRGTIISNTDVRAPLFYDSANTAYYVDPNGVSNLYGVAIRGDAASTNTDNQIFFWGTGNTTTSAIGFKANGGAFPNPTGAGDGYNTYLTMDTDGRGWVFRRGTGGTDFTAAYTSGWILNNGVWQANASMRAPIFYDSANTTYYIDPGSTTSLRTVGSWRSDSAAWDGEFNGKIQYHANHWYFQAADLWLFRNSGGSNVVSISQGGIVNLSGITGAGNTYIQTSTTGTSYTSHFQIREANGGGGNTSEIYAPALGFHWSGVVASNILMESSGRIAIRNNPGSGYENFIANAIYGAVFYDSNDTTYYLDPSAATSLNIAGQITTAKTNGTLLSIAGADTIGYNGTAGRGAYIKGTSTTYVYGSGVYYDGSNIRQMLYEDTWLNNKYFGSDGIIYSAVSMRAPIFYDYNDTNYYLDPNGGSILKNVNLNLLQPRSGVTHSDIYAQDAIINSYYHGDALTYDVFQFNAASLYEIKLTSTHSFSSTTVETSIFKGDRFGGMSIANNTYQVRWTWNNTIGYKFFKTLYIGNSTNGNSFSVTIEYSGNGSTWTTLATSDQMSNWPGHSWYNYAWNNNAAQGYIRITITPTWNTVYDINIYNMRYFASYNLDGSTRLYDWDYSRNVTFPVSLRAPIFYDSDNTAYYVDPASTSNLVGLTVANTITGNISGNAATATNAVNLSTTRSNWSTNGTITAVVGQLCWKNYGNNHTIIDASNSTSPAGGAIGNTNPDYPWTATYPTLMGWNGANTYGVRVDSSRYADQVGYAPSRTDSTAYPVLWGSGTSYTVAYSCAAVTIQSSTGTLNATNVNVSGKLVQNSTTQSITGTGQTLTLNVAAAAVQVISMASGATITTISYTNRDNNPSVNTIMLVVKYAGSASITFTNVLWANGTAPTLTGTNGYADVFMLTSYQGGAGTPVWIGTVVAQALVSTNL